MIVRDARGRIRYVSHGYSPKVHDGTWASLKREEIDEKFAVSRARQVLFYSSFIMFPRAPVSLGISIFRKVERSAGKWSSSPTSRTAQLKVAAKRSGNITKSTRSSGRASNKRLRRSRTLLKYLICLGEIRANLWTVQCFSRSVCLTSVMNDLSSIGASASKLAHHFGIGTRIFFFRDKKIFNLVFQRCVTMVKNELTKRRRFSSVRLALFVIFR